MAPRGLTSEKRAPKRARSRGKRLTRSRVALLLLGFVLLAAGVIARRIYGIQQNGRILKLEQQRAALDAERLRLEGQVRDASSRSRLVPLVEQRLNMHVPSPNQVILLPRAPRGRRPGAAPNDSH